METLFIYFGKVVLTSGTLFLYYRVFLKDKTFHHYNRFYLLGTIVLSLLLPLLRVEYFTIELKGHPYYIVQQIQHFSTPKNIHHGIDAITVVALAIGAVSLMLLARFLYGIFTVFKFKRKFPHENIGNIRLYMTDLDNAPFSFFRNLFWKQDVNTSSPVGRQILKHEMIHIEQKHSHDQMMVQTVAALFWFNPIFYLIKKEISLIHEYLADKKSLKHTDTKTFAQMLLAAQFSGHAIPGTSPLISSNLKKRLKMLQKPKPKYSYARRILALPLTFTVIFVFLVQAKNREIKEINKITESFNSKLAKDTIGVEQKIEEQTKKVGEVQDSIAAKTNKTGSITKEIGKKTEELAKIEKTSGSNSKAYEDKLKEIDQLHSRIDSVYVKLDNNEYRKIGELYGDLDKLYGSKEYQKRIEEMKKKAAEIKGYADTEDFKKAVEKAKAEAEKARKYTSSPGFKKMLNDAQKAAEDGRKAAAEAQKQSAQALAYVNSTEFKKIIADANAAAAEGKRTAALAIADAKKGAQIVLMDGNKIYTSSTKTVTTTGIDDNDFDEIKINGRKATLDELHRLDRKSITSTNINVNTENGSSRKTISVRTK